MIINTKVVFEWDSDTKQYKEVYSEGYEYEGEVDFLQKKSAYYPGRDAKAMGGVEYVILLFHQLEAMVIWGDC